VAGYAASARLHGAAPQFAFAGDHAYAASAHGPDAAAAPDAGGIEQLELVGRPLNEMVVDWLAAIGESWSQLTFFLFDPESWR
jgi:hypothetical protein